MPPPYPPEPQESYGQSLIILKIIRSLALLHLSATCYFKLAPRDMPSKKKKDFNLGHAYAPAAGCGPAAVAQTAQCSWPSGASLRFSGAENRLCKQFGKA